MADPKDMQRCIDYIEQHLCDVINGNTLADMLGYSYYYFCHLFRDHYHIAVGEYIRRQRLLQAARAICNGLPVTQAALLYGFDTPSGFTKAFKRAFGVSPVQYKQQHPKTKGGIRMIMQPRMMEKGAIKAVGYHFVPQDQNVGNASQRAAYWSGQDFSSVSKEDYARLATPNQGDLSIWLCQEYGEEMLSYFFGPVVDSFDFIPEGMKTFTVPPAKYAVFTVDANIRDMRREEYVSAIKTAWKTIFTEWFDQSAYTYDESKYNFELYIDDKTEIYIPVK